MHVDRVSVTAASIEQQQAEAAALSQQATRRALAAAGPAGDEVYRRARPWACTRRVTYGGADQFVRYS